MDKSKEKSNSSKHKKHNEEVEYLKESYKIGKEYYKNVENKIEKTRK